MRVLYYLPEPAWLLSPAGVAGSPTSEQLPGSASLGTLTAIFLFL